MADATNRNARRDCRKLALDEALTIRARYAAGVRARDLAAEHGVSLASVWKRASQCAGSRASGARDDAGVGGRFLARAGDVVVVA
jgi:hypothetical protein